jgi:type I restriction enzyme S subunit
MNDDWRQVPLHELARVDRGASWSKAQEVTDGTGSPVIRIANVQPSGLDLKEVRSVVGMKPRDIERAQIGPHTLLMVGSNGNPERVGNVYQSDSNIEGMSLASFLVGIHSPDELTSKWLYYFLSSDGVQYLLTEATAGSTGLKNLSLEWLRCLEISLPPLRLQRRIVDLMTHLDNQIANLRTERDAGRALRVATLSNLLDATREIPADYDAAFDLADSAQQASPTSEPTMNDEWTETTLTDVCVGGFFGDGDWVESKDQDPRGEFRLLQLKL